MRNLPTPVDPGESQPHKRLAALDGLRGLAAVVVVAHHAILSSSLGDAYVTELAGEDSGSGLASLLANTPLRYLNLGTEAVIIFFILSGFVLTLPMLRGKGLNLWAYYPRRFLRLWLPAAAAMAFAILTIVAIPQRPDDASSDWVRRFTFPELDAQRIVDSFPLVVGSTHLNNPLWSLRWEMLFSLLLPLAFLVALKVRRVAWWGVAACGVASGLGFLTGSSALKFLPIFLAGCLVADVVADRGGPRRPRSAWILLVCGLVLIGVPDVLRVVLPGSHPHAVFSLSQGLVTVGAALLVYSLVGRSGAARALASRPFRFLGRISFALYLVHVPILLGAVHLAHDAPDQILLVSVPTAFLVAWVFCRYIEEPSARLARTAGKRARAALSHR